MCCASGSLLNATSVCPICTVFKPTGRCPHITGVCRNRTNHPRLDVLYLRNAEVECFNGCGYCKWATANPSVQAAQNPGWPGCCRAPVGPVECAMIQAADWPTVSQIHHTPIPTDIKAALSCISSPRQAGKPSAEQQPLAPSFDRRNSVGKSSSSSKPAPAIMGRSRQGSVLAAPPGIPSSAVSPPASSDQQSAAASAPRRQSDPAGDGNRQPHANSSSPGSKHKDLDTLSPRRKAGAKPSPTKAIEPSSPVRRPSSSSNSPPSSKVSSSSPPIVITPPKKTAPAPAPAPVPSSASSSSGSSDSFSSSGTMTSDGGFTDYLSEESEAELQRQAEAKAALVAQTQAEEREFKAARQRLESVDLRPPRSWTAAGRGVSHYPGFPGAAAPVMAGSSARG